MFKNTGNLFRDELHCKSVGEEPRSSEGEAGEGPAVLHIRFCSLFNKCK